ncbi:MAG TPA: NAD(P)H-dependent oxidoreductase [Nocardioides sp.]|nr:NAD(P)H-dependent oxidoreductase [Nocardioides sp.]
MARLLVVHHSPTASVHALSEAVVAGARDDEIDGVEVVVRRALEAAHDEAVDGIVEELLSADGYVLVTPANFGYMSGALKHFFDAVFLRAGGALADDGSAADTPAGRKPYGLLVHGRYDTTGAVRSVGSIVQALGWVQAAEVVEILGDVDDEQRSSAYELGATIAALVST